MNMTKGKIMRLERAMQDRLDEIHSLQDRVLILERQIVAVIALAERVEKKARGGDVESVEPEQDPDE